MKILVIDEGRIETEEKRLFRVWTVEKTDLTIRSGERKYLDELERGVWSAYAGIAVRSFIREHHFFDAIKSVVMLPTSEGYSLEQLSLTFFYFDVFEFRSIEDFKTVYPEGIWSTDRAVKSVPASPHCGDFCTG